MKKKENLGVPLRIEPFLSASVWAVTILPSRVYLVYSYDLLTLT